MYVKCWSQSALGRFYLQVKGTSISFPAKLLAVVPELVIFPAPSLLIHLIPPLRLYNPAIPQPCD